MKYFHGLSQSLHLRRYRKSVSMRNAIFLCSVHNCTVQNISLNFQILVEMGHRDIRYTGMSEGPRIWERVVSNVVGKICSHWLR